MQILLEPKRLQIAVIACSENVRRANLQAVTVKCGENATFYYSTNGAVALKQQSSVVSKQQVELAINRFDAELIGRLRVATVPYYKQGDYWKSDTPGSPTFTETKGISVDSHENLFSRKAPFTPVVTDFDFDDIALFAKVAKKLKSPRSPRLIPYGTDHHGVVEFPKQCGVFGIVSPLRFKE